MTRKKTLPWLSVVSLIVTTLSPAADLHWDGTDSTGDADGGDGTWDTTATNWDDAATAGSDTAWSNATPDSAIFGAAAGTVTLGEAISVGDLTFDSAGYDITGAPDLTIASPTTVTANADATISAQMIGAGALTKAGTGNLTLGAANTYTGATTINAGTVTLNAGAHTTVINAASEITVNSGATLAIGNTNSIQRGAGDASVILDGGTLNHSAGGHAHIGNITLKNGALWTATSGSSYNGENVQFNGTVTVSGTSASTIGPFSAGIGLNGDREFNVADVTGDAGDDLIVSGELENNDTAPGDGIIKTGDGTLYLATNASYSGQTVINGGVFAMGASLNGNSEVHINAGATLELRSTNIFLRTAANAAVIIDGGTLTMIAGGPNHNKFGNMTLMNGAVWTTEAGTNSWDGENYVIRDGSTVTVGGTSPSTMSAEDGVNIAEGGGIITFDVADVTGDSAPDLLVNTELEQGGSLTKTGAGTMRIGTGASYTGQTTVSGGTFLVNSTLRNSSGFTVETGGTLELGATNIFVGGHGTAMADSKVITVNGGTLLMNGSFDSRFGNVTLNDGATWTSDRGLGAWDALLANTDAGAATVTVGGTGASTMNGSGGIHLQGVQNFAVADATGDASADLIVDMILAGPGSAGGAAGGINKTGAGTMLINSNSTYTGITTVAEGAFGGTGSISSNITVASGATLAPGASTGTLTINADATIDGILAFELDGAASDLLVVSGILDIDGSTLDVSDLGGGWTENVYVVAEYGTLNGTFGTITGLDPAYSVVYDYAGSTQVALIPEPAAISLLSLGALGLLIRRRR